MIVRIPCSCGEALGADTAQAVPFIVCPKCGRQHDVAQASVSIAAQPSRPASSSGGFRGAVWVVPVVGTVAAVLLVAGVIFWAATGPNDSPSPSVLNPGTDSTVIPAPVPVPPPAAPAEAPSPLVEQAARDTLDAIRKFEADPAVPRSDLISLYEKNLIALYPNTKAAVEARQRIAVLRKAGGTATKAPSRLPAARPAAAAPQGGG